ncbi:MAG: family 2 glycosyl transferase [Candidatus Saccharibacteria bacterium]|nr:family 2 glycosyl transferase [Candidatus Saccharibacteria bacterium]
MRIGIYNPNLSTKGGGEKVCLALAEALSPGNVVLILTHATLETKELEDYFGVNLSRTRISVMKKSNLSHRIQRSRKIPNHFKKFLENYEVFRNARKLNLDIFVNNAYNTEIPSPAPQGVYMCMFPHKLLDVGSMPFVKRVYIRSVNLLSRLLMYPQSNTWLETYQTITANSLFTQKYIKKYWNRDSRIIYPISDGIDNKTDKRKIILNVGRFFHNNGITHHKRQDFLVDTFIKMKELHSEGWELHFAGTVNENVHDMSYAIDLMRRSDGYPIYLHFDSPLNKLKDLYSQSKIYWHATGYGASTSKNPERQEHFGISTVEAMSAGAIPIVINSAGQKEIVTEGINGYLWSTEQELVDKTRALIKLDDAPSKEISTKAVESSKKYDKRAFQQSAVTVFERLY